MPVSGLSFLHPAALWALATLAIPILIHLFNRSRGRLVKIGHIDLIRNARQLKVTELKLADWLLLLLRLCLFALAALLLAGLAQPGLSSSKKTTAYVSPAWLNNATPEAVSELLQRYSDTKSSRVILLQDNFPSLDTDLAEKLRRGAPVSENAGNIWPLLAERLSLERHHGNVEVFAADNLAQFGTYRPALPGAVSWHLTHIEASDSPPPIDVTAVLAYDQTRRQDAQFVNAALNVLKTNRLPGLNWRLIEIDALSSELQLPDWLILLSESATDINSLKNLAAPKVVLTDAYGDGISTAAEQLGLPFYPFSEVRISRTGTPMEKRTSLASLQNRRPVLQQSWEGPTRLLHYNSRFNPAWSSIAQQAEFPELLLQLMLNDAQHKQAFAGAVVMSSQLLHATQARATPLPRRSLQQILAALMVLIWISERWLSERRLRAGKRREKR